LAALLPYSLSLTLLVTSISNMKSLFTNAERAALTEERTYSKSTHGFNDSIDYTNRNRYGTNANGSKYAK